MCVYVHVGCLYVGIIFLGCLTTLNTLLQCLINAITHSLRSLFVQKVELAEQLTDKMNCNFLWYGSYARMKLPPSPTTKPLFMVFVHSYELLLRLFLYVTMVTFVLNLCVCFCACFLLCCDVMRGTRRHHRQDILIERGKDFTRPLDICFETTKVSVSITVNTCHILH